MFTENDPDNGPVTVFVTPGRWDVVDEPTPRNIMLTQILTDIGGIADSVPPGTYKFNATIVGDKIHATLDPA